MTSAPGGGVVEPVTVREALARTPAHHELLEGEGGALPLISELESLAGDWTDDFLSSLVRRDELGVSLSFEDAVPLLTSIRSDLRALAVMNPMEVPAPKIEAAKSQIVSANNSIQAIKAFSTAVSDPSRERQGLLQNVQQIRDWFATDIRPLTRDTSGEQAWTMRQQLEDLGAQVGDLKQELQDALSTVRSEAVSRAAGTVSPYYMEQARDHKATADKFLRGMIASAVLLIGAVVYLFGLEPPSTGKGGSDALLFTREALARVLGLSVLAFVLAFVARNYRVHKHLQTTNENRYNALRTSDEFQAAVNSDTARDIVVAELVRAIFAGGDTGFLSSDSDRTVIENPGGTITALAALGRGRPGP